MSLRYVNAFAPERASDRSPFVGSITELLQSASSAQSTIADETATDDEDSEDASQIMKSLAVESTRGRELSGDEIPF